MRKLIPITFIFLFLISSPLRAETQRIISLAPAATEILFALGLDKEIVGVTTFCDYPEAAKAKEKIGTFSNPSIEKILSLKPDIIFATGLEQKIVVERLRKVGLQVHVTHPATISELLTEIEKIGKLTSKLTTAIELTKGMEARVKAIKKITQSIPNNEKPKVFIEIWPSPLFTAGKGSFVDELITLAGGINIAHNTPRPYTYFSSEDVIKADPDQIITGYMSSKPSKEELKNRLGWSSIKAVKNNQVHNDINSALFLRPGPRLVDGLEEIYKTIHSHEN